MPRSSDTVRRPAHLMVHMNPAAVIHLRYGGQNLGDLADLLQPVRCIHNRGHEFQADHSERAVRFQRPLLALSDGVLVAGGTDRNPGRFQGGNDLLVGHAGTFLELDFNSIVSIANLVFVHNCCPFQSSILLNKNKLCYSPIVAPWFFVSIEYAIEYAIYYKKKRRLFQAREGHAGTEGCMEWRTWATAVFLGGRDLIWFMEGSAVGPTIGKIWRRMAGILDSQNRPLFRFLGCGGTNRRHIFTAKS